MLTLKVNLLRHKILLKPLLHTTMLNILLTLVSYFVIIVVQDRILFSLEIAQLEARNALNVKKIGHFGQFRQSRRVASLSDVDVVDEMYSEPTLENTILSITEGDFQTHKLGQVSHNDKDIDAEPYVPPMCMITVDGKEIEVMADSGSPYTIISDTFFNKSWKDKILEPNDIRVYGFGGKEIDMLGYFTSDISFKQRTIVGKVYVAVDGLQVLGWKHQGKLNITLCPNAKIQVCIVEDLHIVHNDIQNNKEAVQVILDKHKNVFKKELGNVKGFSHRIVFF